MKTRLLTSILRISLGFYVAPSLIGCSPAPQPGPDKTFAYEGAGALQGAGAGAIVGFQVSAAAGPGAAVGAGLGAVAGALRGAVQDNLEETDLATQHDMREQQTRMSAQQALAEHYKRRLELHPTRDIFPADLFFSGDSVHMCPSGISVVRELARMNEYRLPYSRLIVATYVKANDPQSAYAQHLSERRAREFVNQMVRAGIEPRRLETRPVIVDVPVLIDPLDNPARYNQAIELIPADR